MMRAILLLTSLPYFFSSLCVAAPATPSNNVTVVAVVAAEEDRCRDITPSTLGPDPACWDVLKMDDWIREWTSAPQACAQYEPWSNCFMRLTNKGANGIDCVSIYSTKGCYPPVVGDIVQGPAEIWYGAWSIWFLHEYMTKLSLWLFHHQPEEYSPNVPRIINFLTSDTPPWVNDTGLHRLDRRVAKIMNDTWNSDSLNGDYKDDEIYNLGNVLWRAMRFRDTADFLSLASEGGLLHSPL